MSTHGKDYDKTSSDDPGGVPHLSDRDVAMSTYTQILYHIVFSTKGREPARNGGPLQGPLSSSFSWPLPTGLRSCLKIQEEAQIVARFKGVCFLIALTPSLSQREREPIWSRFGVPSPFGRGSGEG